MCITWAPLMGISPPKHLFLISYWSKCWFTTQKAEMNCLIKVKIQVPRSQVSLQCCWFNCSLIRAETQIDRGPKVTVQCLDTADVKGTRLCGDLYPQGGRASHLCFNRQRHWAETWQKREAVGGEVSVQGEITWDVLPTPWLVMCFRWLLVMFCKESVCTVQPVGMGKQTCSSGALKPRVSQSPGLRKTAWRLCGVGRSACWPCVKY